MGILTYTATVSIDGYAADAAGDFAWAGPNDSVFDLHISRIASTTTEILGRNTYQLMRYWEAEPDGEVWSDREWQFARGWEAIEKVVVSSTLTPADLAPERTRLVPELGLDELQRIVDEAEGAVEIFGPTTASAAIRAGMIEEFHIFVVPIIVGGGLRALPDGARLDLRLTDHRVYDNGAVYSHYVRR